MFSYGQPRVHTNTLSTKLNEIGPIRGFLLRNNRVYLGLPVKLKATCVLLMISICLATSPVMALDAELEFALDLHKRGKVNEAIDGYTDYIKKNEKSSEAYNWRGMAYDDLGKTDEALADFNKAITLSPDYADAYNNRGEIQRKKKLYREALMDFKRAADIDKNYVEAHYNMGLVFEEQKQFPRAIAEYSVYLEKFPNAPDKVQVQQRIDNLKKMSADASSSPTPSGARVESPKAGEPRPLPGSPPTAKAPGDSPLAPEIAKPRAGMIPKSEPGIMDEIPIPEEQKQMLMYLAVAFGWILLLAILVPYIFCSIMLYLIGKKTSIPMPWLAFIPIARTLLRVKIAGLPTWWLALSLAWILSIPILLLSSVDPTEGVIVMILAGLTGFILPAVARFMISLGISNARGKGTIWGLILFFPPTEIVGYGYLGLSK